MVNFEPTALYSPTPSTDRVGQQYGTFESRLAEITRKASTTEIVQNDFYGEIIRYFDKDGNNIGSSAAPNPEKGTAGYIIDGSTTFFSSKDGKITTIGDADKATVYHDENGDGNIDKNEAGYGFLA